MRTERRPDGKQYASDLNYFWQPRIHTYTHKVGQHNIIYHYKILRCPFANSRHHEYGVNIIAHGWYNVRHYSDIIVKNITWKTLELTREPNRSRVPNNRKNEAKKPYANGVRLAAAVSII